MHFYKNDQTGVMKEGFFNSFPSPVHTFFKNIFEIEP